MTALTTHKIINLPGFVGVIRTGNITFLVLLVLYAQEIEPSWVCWCSTCKNYNLPGFVGVIRARNITFLGLLVLYAQEIEPFWLCWCYTHRKKNFSECVGVKHRGNRSFLWRCFGYGQYELPDLNILRIEKYASLVKINKSKNLEFRYFGVCD